MNWKIDRELIEGAYFTAINANNIELFKIIDKNYDKLKEVFPFIEYVIERLCAANTLIQAEQVWDADIIIRSTLETFVKYAFIVETDEPERPILLNEFWNDLSEIYSIKLSEQAKKNLKHTSNSDLHWLAYNPLLLSEADQEKLRSKWPKSIRTKIEQKWSFSGIISFLSQKNKGTPLESIEFLTHSYRMSSHIAHGDEIGINMIRERKSRVDHEKQAVHIAHHLRLLSDCFSYSIMTSFYTMQYLKLDPVFFLDLSTSLKEFDPLIKQYHMVPFNDKIYDKFK